MIVQDSQNYCSEEQLQRLQKDHYYNHVKLLLSLRAYLRNQKSPKTILSQKKNLKHVELIAKAIVKSNVNRIDHGRQFPDIEHVITKLNPKIIRQWNTYRMGYVDPFYRP